MSSDEQVKVSEILILAGAVFKKLGDLTMQLQQTDSSENAKLSEEEVDMLSEAVQRFGEDLNYITERIREKTVIQIKNKMKKTTVEDAEIPVQETTSAPVLVLPVSTFNPQPQPQLGMLPTSDQEVTLNTRNAPEVEPDAEELDEYIEVEFDPDFTL